jgi:ubiquitin-protein ligase E3 D
MPANAEEISLYAELLSNIRQVSLAATLPSPSDDSTEARVSSDGKQVVVRHHGKSQMLKLPAQVAEGSLLSILRPGLQDLSWRLSLRAAASYPGGPSSSLPRTPWPAADLLPGRPIACRECGQYFIKADTIRSWKDLPSENWAEMMELWHCHKPDKEHPADEEHLVTRGYGANSVIRAQDGVGLVDVMFMLFSESDTLSLKVCEFLMVSSLISHLYRVSRR